MAALTASNIRNYNLGSVTLLIVTLTVGSTSDTWTMYPGAPIVDCWVRGIIGENVTFNQSTGVFTLTNSSGTGAVSLFVLVANA